MRNSNNSVMIWVIISSLPLWSVMTLLAPLKSMPMCVSPSIIDNEPLMPPWEVPVNARTIATKYNLLVLNIPAPLGDSNTPRLLGPIIVPWILELLLYTGFLMLKRNAGVLITFAFVMVEKIILPGNTTRALLEKWLWRRFNPLTLWNK